MNINLPNTTLTEIYAHYDILSGAVPQEIVSTPVLIPDPEYPNAFQVWWPTAEQFVHVTPDGFIVWADFLPTPEEFIFVN